MIDTLPEPDPFVALFSESAGRVLVTVADAGPLVGAGGGRRCARDDDRADGRRRARRRAVPALAARRAADGVGGARCPRCSAEPRPPPPAPPRSVALRSALPGSPRHASPRWGSIVAAKPRDWAARFTCWGCAKWVDGVRSRPGMTSVARAGGCAGASVGAVAGGTASGRGGGGRDSAPCSPGSTAARRRSGRCSGPR